MKRDLTIGSIGKTIAYFSVPYLLSYLLQTLYGMADLFIIGQFCGVEDTTAVSIGSQVMHMLTVMIVGLAMGSTVMIARFVGGKKEKEMRLAVGNTVTLFAGVSIVLLFVLLLLVHPIVSVMSTPDEAVSGTVAYLTICFIGVPAIVAYNIISSIFRGMGDSKSPMYYIAIACGCNILLDLLFIGKLSMGAAGAALGTTIAQAISVVISLVMIWKRKMIGDITKADFRPQKEMMKNIFKVGFPVSMQDGFVQISFLIITVFANQRGLNDAAAVGVVEKLIGILFLIPSTMLSTVSALAAQNIGAGRHDRAKQILRYALGIAVGFGVAASLAMQVLAEPAVGLFVDDQTVRILGGQYMRSYVWDCVFAGMHFCYSGYFCAYGRSNLSFLHNAISILFARIPLAYFASVYFTDSLFPMGCAAPIGSVLSVIVCVIALRWMFARKEIKNCETHELRK